MLRSAALLALLLSAACGSDSGQAEDTAPRTDSVAAAAPEGDPAAPAAAPAADTAWTVRPDGMGPVRIGMTFDEARAALGGDLAMSENVIGTEDGPGRCDHPRSARLPAGTRVMVEGQRVVRVEVDSASVPTAEGARVGDTEARIQQLYPQRVTVMPHKYTDGHYLVVRGPAAADTARLIVFETDGRVVQRYRAGQNPQVQYVEGCA